jgi:PAS domain S-box-containing protein
MTEGDPKKKPFSATDEASADGAEAGFAEERYLLRALLETCTDYIYFKDRDSRFIRSSEAHARHLGLAEASSMVGLTDADFFGAEQAEAALEEERSIIETGRPVAVEQKDTVIGHAESWVQTVKWPLKNDKGEIVGTFGISRDVTDRKLAQERVARLLQEKDTLLREVRHRIKNNFSTIYSLISLQADAAREGPVRAALEDVKNRIHGIMFLHDRMNVADEFGEVEVRDYLSPFIDGLVANFPRAGSVRVRKEIEDFALDSKTLQTLVMIVNELVTNAMKHAFVGRERGSIRVAASPARVPGGVGARVALTVEDDGVGLPEGVDFDNSAGLGLVLAGLLVKQMDGTIRLEREGGTRIVMEFEA